MNRNLIWLLIVAWLGAAMWLTCQPRTLATNPAAAIEREVATAKQKEFRFQEKFSVSSYTDEKDKLHFVLSGTAQFLFAKDATNAYAPHAVAVDIINPQLLSFYVDGVKVPASLLIDYMANTNYAVSKIR